MQSPHVVLRRAWFLSALLLQASFAWSPHASASTADAAVHSIILPHFELELPAVPGRDEYLAVCVSCHSPRYVLMQPPFPQKQWEETVDKMVKVYGAQLDQDQRAGIVQFLVATHGPDSVRAPARDEDADFTATQPSLRPDTSPSLNLAAEQAEHAKQVDRGAELFKKECAACHGAAGLGDGFVAPALLRKPKDLATTRFSLKLLSQVLWNGKRGTAMPSWRSLPLADLATLAAFVQSLHEPDKNSATASSEALGRGKEVFLMNCAPCHGVAGDGKGTAASALIPGPANFQLKQPNLDYVLDVLKDGIPGTGMPSWKDQISEPDRNALAHFVRSFFKAGSPTKP